jgi:hypothetical protein
MHRLLLLFGAMLVPALSLAQAPDHVQVRRFDADACEMQLRFKGGRVILSDDGRCREKTCGARGSYDGITLPKRGSL